MAAKHGRVYPRCVGGRRAGPPEGSGGPWAFLEATQPHLVFAATLRAAEIVAELLDADPDAEVGATLGEIARSSRRCCRCSGWSVSTAGVSTGPWPTSPPDRRRPRHEGDRSGCPAHRRRHRHRRSGGGPRGVLPRSGHPRSGHGGPAAFRGQGPARRGPGRCRRRPGHRRGRSADRVPALRDGPAAQGHRPGRGAQPVRHPAGAQPAVVALRLPPTVDPDLPPGGRAAARADHPRAGLPPSPLRRARLLPGFGQPARRGAPARSDPARRYGPPPHPRRGHTTGDRARPGAAQFHLRLPTRLGAATPTGPAADRGPGRRLRPRGHPALAPAMAGSR